MINIFYNQSYWKKETLLFTKQFQYSKLNDLIQLIFYKFNFPLPNRFITNGPQKLINNILRMYLFESIVSFNKNKFKHNLILQFDNFGQKTLESILNNNTRGTIFIGPLFSDKIKVVIDYKEKFENIKLVASSENMKNFFLDTYNSLNSDDVIILPSPIKIPKKVLSNKKKKSTDCLIYFKKRNKDDLFEVTQILEDLNLSYKIFEYGNYKNPHLINFAKKVNFGIIVDKSESQGIAINELMANSLPLIVWEDDSNTFNGISSIHAKSVPFWSEECGMLVHSKNELKNSIELMNVTYSQFSPQEYIKNNLSFEICKKHILENIE